MHSINNRSNLPAKQSPPSKPERETEEVPTLILDGAQFRSYRLLQRINSAAQQAAPPALHQPSTR